MPYKPREASAWGRIKINGVALKAYYITAPHRLHTRCQPLDSFVEPLVGVAGDLLAPPTAQTGHAAGFLIVHLGADGDYLLVSRWCGSNMLRHRVFNFDAHSPTPRLVPLSSPDIIACVWELEIIKFERDAWVRTVLSGGDQSDPSHDLARYLNTTFSGWV